MTRVRVAVAKIRMSNLVMAQPLYIIIFVICFKRHVANDVATVYVRLHDLQIVTEPFGCVEQDTVNKGVKWCLLLAGCHTEP